jgi:hypothetical protein
MGYLKNLDKERSQFQKKAFPKGRDRIVIGVIISGNEAKSYGIVGCSF